MRSRTVQLPLSLLRGRVRTYFGQTVSLHNVGHIGSVDHRVQFISHEGDKISPWHHVPLVAAQTHFNFMVEIPKGNRMKYEVATKEPLNPLKFDVKDGKPRLYPFPSIVNYGMIPQTWEDPSRVDPHLGVAGDNDPIDVCEIGIKPARLGEIYPVKVLGALGMIDGGEADWKIVAIRFTDPLADQIHDLTDIPAHYGDVVDRVVYWFSSYKAVGGKNPVTISRIENAAFARDVILDAHNSWKAFVSHQQSLPPMDVALELQRVVNPPLWTPPKVKVSNVYEEWINP